MTIQTPMFPADPPDASLCPIATPGFASWSEQQLAAQDTQRALASLRREAAAEIDRLLAFLDAVDVDPDLEDNGDAEGEPDGEPSLGWTEQEARRGKYAPIDSWHCDGELDTADDEPSLGSVAAFANLSQIGWSQGGTDDREDEHDGSEPDEDGEPSLGSFDRMVDQTRSWRQRGEAALWLDGELDRADWESDPDLEASDQAVQS